MAFHTPVPMHNYNTDTKVKKWTEKPDITASAAVVNVVPRRANHRSAGLVAVVR